MPLPPNDSGQLKVSTIIGKGLPTSVPKEMIAAKIHEHQGNIMKVCDDLNLLYVPLQQFIDKNYELRDLVIGARTSLTDMAEDVLRTHLNSNNLKAAVFTLQTLGKDKGYVPKMETESHIIKEERKTVDLSKLSTSQLKDLRRLMSRASGMIDVTPVDVTKKDEKDVAP